MTTFDKAITEQLLACYPCKHPNPADYGASQVINGTLVHNCADCGVLMAWSVS
jgi:hypothetical protein